MLALPRLRRLPAILLALTGIATLTAGTPAVARPIQPNVVVIMVDDMNMYALRYLRNVQSLIAGQGTTFDTSVVSYSLCCPSRATFLTGQYAHNHGVLNNAPPDGGYEKLPAETLPVWLGRAGYDTGHVGKFLNRYGRANPTEIPPGWSEWYGSVDPTTYRMWGYTLNENGVLRTYGTPGVEDPELYQTDVYARKAVDFIRRKAPAGKPFFLSFAPLAPHGEGNTPAEFRTRRNPRPAPRHLGAMDGVTLPKPPSFDEADVSDKPAAVRNRPRIGAAAQQRMQNVALKGRLESLLAVDDAVAGIVKALRESGELNDTLIVFTSDNGWMQGEHRIRNGKVVPYEESIRVPLIMRGPGLPAGKHVKTIAANIDLTPTILDAAHATAAVTLDGRSLLPFVNGDATIPRAVVIETGPRTGGGNWYAGLRAQRWKYVEHSTGELELYDLQRDPYELTSVHADPSYDATRQALAERLARLRTCAGAACHQWSPVPGPRL